MRLHTERFHKVELEASKPVKKRELREIKPAIEEVEELDLEMEVEEGMEDDPFQGKLEKYPQNNVYFRSNFIFTYIE